jgi:hypothetical protein
VGVGVTVFDLAREEYDRVVEQRARALLDGIELAEQIHQLLDLPGIDLGQFVEVRLQVLVV